MIFRGESSVTLAASSPAGQGAPPVQTPVAWMCPTRRSPLALCSMTWIEPFVDMSILPELSALPNTAFVSSSFHVASTSVYARYVIAVAVDGWWTPMLWPARRSVNV